MPYSRLLFSGVAGSTQTLYSFDGTSSTDLAPSDASAGGVQPAFITPLGNGLVLFNGQDAAGASTLWVTDGTSDGTSELTPDGGVVAYPQSFAVLNGEAYFAAASTLWRSDGTAAGTEAISGVTNVSSSGLSPNSLYAAGSTLYFAGTDAGGTSALWSSDGTAVGTREVTASAVAPSYFATLGPTVYFSAADGSGRFGLWSTDGTPSGTAEITSGDPANAFGFSPTDLIAFAGEIYFAALDEQGRNSLFVSDGTAAGTHEMTVADGSANGLDPTNIAVLDPGTLVFAGTDTSGNVDLFVSDGSSSGTTALSVGGASGDVGLSPTDFALFDGALYFDGIDATDTNTLWKTDGTAAGTVPVTPGVSIPTGLVTADVTACFASGTKILTSDGEVAVEALAVGARVPTVVSGRYARVIWVGTRAVDCRAHPNPATVWPIRVVAGAFGEGCPARDLHLSPDHAVYVPGGGRARSALVPVRYLVNGASVRREPVDRVTYWHVELEAHDVLFANGLTVESYLDTGNRGAFSNGGSVVMAHPDFARSVWEAKACADLVITGPVLMAAKAGLMERVEALGFARTSEPDLRLRCGSVSIVPVREGRICRFALSPGVAEASLVSRAMAPAEMLPTSEDCRRLGVAVASLEVDGHIVDPSSGAGWHPSEGGFQWTNGNASIACAGAREIVVTLAPFTASYWDERRTAQRQDEPVWRLARP